jgi:beta-N-acetylhexosaminidase
MRQPLLRLILGILLILSLCCLPAAVYKPQLIYGPAEAKWVKQSLAKMTLEEKIGQMVSCRYLGRFVNQDSDYLKELVGLVTEGRIGGLIIFGGEVYETALLTNYLQERAKIPLLIAADFEWGAAMRINGTTLFPPFMALGATNSDDLAYQMGKITALEARAMGIHMTYAPVVDVNVNPDNPVISTRSLGENPEDVGRLAVSFIRGCQENGLIATAKHFPGHGDTNVDSHSLLPTIKAERSRLEKIELYPFARAIQAGVQAVMTAHVNVPALDATPGLPATLSPLILTQLLRKEMGFKGLIVTDAMTMGGITNTFTAEEAALKAVEAGVDMVLLPSDPPGVIAALTGAVSSGAIKESRVDESVMRILELKARAGLNRHKLVDINLLPLKVASKEHLKQAELTFEKSVTLVKNEGNILPLSPATPGKRITVFSLSSDPDDFYAGGPFIREVQKRKPGASNFYADAFTGQEYIQEAKAKAVNADIIIFALFSSLRTAKGSVDLLPRHIELVKQMAAGPAKVIVLSFGSPYFLRHFPDVDAYVCLYRGTAQAQEVAAKAVFGEIDLVGMLPVSIPGLYPLGHGLMLSKQF